MWTAASVRSAASSAFLTTVAPRISVSVRTKSCLPKALLGRPGPQTHHRMPSVVGLPGCECRTRRPGPLLAGSSEREPQTHRRKPVARRHIGARNSRASATAAPGRLKTLRRLDAAEGNRTEVPMPWPAGTGGSRVPPAHPVQSKGRGRRGVMVMGTDRSRPAPYAPCGVGLTIGWPVVAPVTTGSVHACFNAGA